MNQALLFQMALARLARYKAKSFLMSIGIVVSVVACVLVQTVGTGFRGALDRFVARAYPVDSLQLISGSSVMGSAISRNNLRLADVEAVLGMSSEMTGWDPMVQGGMKEIKHGAVQVQVPLAGYSEQAPAVRRRGVEQGQPFTAEEVRDRARVALVGTTTARKLFRGKSPLGERIYIDNVAFEIKGVLEAIGVDPHGGDQDDVVHLPYTTLMDHVLRIDYLSGVSFVLGDHNRVEALAPRIAALMRERHQIGPGQQDDFSLVTPVGMQAMIDRTFKVFDIFMPLIAGAAFLVSGLLILSIMWIGINERRAEIGLRKALGARPPDVVRQILIEVLILAGLAGLVGAILAQLLLMAAAPTMALKFGITRLVPAESVLVAALAASLLTGLAGAMWPARRAAALDPVAALKCS